MEEHLILGAIQHHKTTNCVVSEYLLFNMMEKCLTSVNHTLYAHVN